MGNEYYDKDGYVFTKTDGSFEPKWDVWSQSQPRVGGDLNNNPSGYTSDGRPLYTRRESASSDSSSSDDGFSLVIAIILLIIVIAAAIVLYAILAPAIAAIRKELKTNEGKKQLRAFAITIAVSISLVILSVATSRSLLGFYSNDWFRLIQFVLTTIFWGVTIHYGIKREYWRPALESCRYFGRSYIEEFTKTFKSLGNTISGYASR